MIRALLLPHLCTAIVAVILRDLSCFAAVKIFCWRKRRESQREAQKNRELRQLSAELASLEKAEEEQKLKARIAKAATAPKFPFPKLVGGPLIITARSREEVYLYCRQVSSNIVAQGANCFAESDFENN
jgi:hypothetical protein